MAQEDFAQLMQLDGLYYAGRWEYYREVVALIRGEVVAKVLELGPSVMPVVKDADVMVKPENDTWRRPAVRAPREYLHDATVTPWPIGDREYDLFVALQVWEHLAGKQREAFAEVKRIARMAILSFPYLWDCPKDNRNYPEHHMIDERIIADWTLDLEPVQVIRIPRTGERVSKGPRIIYFWRF